MKKVFYSLMASLVLPAAIMAGASNAEAKDKNYDQDWVEEKMEDVMEDYNKAIKKINESSFTAEQKNILTAQAAANRDLMSSQINAIAQQMRKNIQQRADFKDAIRASRENKKAVKEIDDIL